jgi:hypothetical protein
MEEKKLEVFRIGDTRKATVLAPKKPPPPSREERSQAASLGFRRIEKILEDEDPEILGQSLSKLLKDLEAFQKRAKGTKDKSAVKKAIAAVERTADLMDYLFQTRAALRAQQAAK